MPKKGEGEFEITETELPSSARGRGSAYDKVLTAFQESEAKTVLVTMKDKQTKNIVIGLRNLIQRKELSSEISAVTREGKAYLTRSES